MVWKASLGRPSLRSLRTRSSKSATSVGLVRPPSARSEILAGEPLISIDEVVRRIEAVTREDLEALVAELWAPGQLAVAGIGPDEARFQEALAGALPALVGA